MKLTGPCALLAIAGFGTVYGQMPSGAPVDPASHRQLEEIIVTAQKRGERLADVPVTIAVLDGADLDGSSLGGVTEALHTVPGVATPSSYMGGAVLLSVRGVGASGPMFSGSSPIAYYLDSAPFGFVSSAIAPDADAYDLQHIEVLRGPQGTLYGANAQNGVVRVLTNDADPRTFEMKARLTGSRTAGGSDGWRGDLALNAPLIADRLAVRAVLGYREAGGWIDGPVGHNVNDTRQRTYRLKLLALPADRLRIGLSAWQSHSDDGAPPAADDQGRISATQPQPISADMGVYGLDVDAGIGPLSLSSRTSLLDYSNFSAWDTTAAGVPDTTVSTQLDSRVLAQELVLNSPAEGRWRWTAGAAWRHARDGLVQKFIWFPAPLDYSFGSTSWAAFGEGGRRFGGDRFEWTLGLRYFHDTVFNRENVQSQGLTGIPLYHATDGFHAVTPRIVLSWRPASGVTVYSSYSQGFRSGFPQNAAIIHAAPDYPAMKPDRLHNYELGARAALSERVSFDGAIYYIKWRHVQQALSVWINGVPEVANVNGESASGVGTDLDIRIRPLAGLDLGIGLSWNSLALDRAVYIPEGLLFDKGDRLNYSPQFSGNLFASYRHRLGSRGFTGAFVVSAGYGSGQDYRGGDNGVIVNRGDALLLARAGFTLAAPAHWTATLFADNLTNENGMTPSVNLLPEWQLRQRPRTVGIQFDYRL